MTDIEMMLTISEDDAIRNHLDPGPIDIVNIKKEEGNTIVFGHCFVFIFTLERYAFVTWSLIWK